jgi:hypothetical protein
MKAGTPERGKNPVLTQTDPTEGTSTVLVLATPIPVLTTDAFGKDWSPGLLLEIRGGLALVQVENGRTVRPLKEIRLMGG